MSIDLDATLLRSFVTASRAGSISRAAQALGRTQPALSQQLRRLEDLVGRPLLRRTPSGVALTPAGETLMPYAERILALSSEALAGAGAEGLHGRCGIGLMEDLAAAALPAALADFAKLHPEVQLEIMVASGEAMRDAFNNGHLQLVLGDTSYFPIQPRWSVSLPLTWAAAPGFDRNTDPLPLILFSLPCQWRRPLLDALDRKGRAWRIAFESTSLTAVQAAIRAGLGVAALLPANLQAGMTVLEPGDDLPSISAVTLGLVRQPGSEGEPLLNNLELLLRRLLG